MKKFILDLTVNSVEALSDKHVLIKLTDDKPLPEMLPGQFVEVRVDNSPSTFLRRPISINNVDYDKNELWLLVAAVGDGTKRLQLLQKGDKLIGLVHPDYDEAKAMDFNDDDLMSIMEQNRLKLNEQLPPFCKISELRLHEDEFVKTPKKSIKRYLYKDV